MKNRRYASIGLCAALACNALAPNGRAEEKVSTTLLLPARLEGSTSGKGTLEVGIGAARGIRHDLNLAVMLTASAKTENGMASLWEYQFEKNKPLTGAAGSMGLGISLAVLPAKPETIGRSRLPLHILQRIFSTCSAQCSSEKTDFCASRGDQLKDRLTSWINDSYATLGQSSFCQSEQEAVHKADNADTTHEVKKEARKKALENCVAACPSSGTDPFCQTQKVSEELAHLYIDYRPNEFCAEGKAIYDEYGDALGRSLSPTVLVNAGATVGRQYFSYRAGDSSGVLVEQDKGTTPWSTGVSVAGLPGNIRPHQVTIEAQMIYASTWKPSDGTVEWCEPADNVAGSTSGDNNSSPPTYPGQTCREAVLDEPTQKQTFTFGMRVGVVDGIAYRWRLAAGPDFSINTTGKGALVEEVALRVPLYLSASIFSGVSYKGILRLTPSLVVRPQLNGPADVTATMGIALLGQRFMFSDRFDTL